MSDYNQLSHLITTAYARLLLMHYKAHSGHIGGNTSCFEAIMTLHHVIMHDDDRFVLSKGHAAGALYVTLWSLGRISDLDLNTFCQNNTALAGHPSGAGVPGLLFSTGSLGHGPSLAAGLALAAREKGELRSVFCLCSDGEWQEGSCWEALIFAVHHRLDMLTILVDQNGFQGFGSTKEVVSIEDLAPRFLAFGASVVSANGHDPDAIIAAVAQRELGKPHVVVLHTRKGRGLHFENTMESHYLPLTAEQYELSCAIMDNKVKV